MSKWIVTLEQHGDDLILPLPPEVLEELGLGENDWVQWHDNGDGTYTITKTEFDSDSGVEGKL